MGGEKIWRRVFVVNAKSVFLLVPSGFLCEIAFSRCSSQFFLPRVVLYRPYFSRSVRKLEVFAVFTPTGLDESVSLTHLAGFGVSLAGSGFVIRFFWKAASADDSKPDV